MHDGRTVFRRMCERTTIHGVPDWYESKNALSKALWTVILLGAFFAIGYYTYATVQAYLQHQTVTRITVVRVNELEFPNITVCSSGRYNHTYIKGAIAVPPELTDQADAIRDQFPRYLLPLAYQKVSFPQQTMQILKRTYDYNFNTSINSKAYGDVRRFLYDAAFDCPSTLEQILFMLKYFDPCNRAETVLTDYGVCYKIPTEGRAQNETAAQMYPGQMTGYRFSARFIRSEATQLGDGDDDGIRVHLGDFAEPNDYDAIIVPPRTHAMVRLKPKRRIIDPATSQCLKTPPTLAYHDKYTPRLCQNECVYNLSMKTCGCAPGGYNARVSPGMMCDPQQMLKCVLPLIEKEETELKACYSTRCLKFCDTWTYNPALSFTALRAGVLGTADVPDWTKVTIYYSHMQYMKLEEEPLMNFETFICNLGGMWGLWTGVSVVALLQCCYILFCGWWEKDEEDQDEEEALLDESSSTAVNDTHGINNK